MARYGTRADSDGRNRYEIVAQAHLVTRQLSKLSVQLDIPLRTLKRIVAEPEFERVFKQLKLELMEDARIKFRNNVDPAFETILEIMNDKFVAPAVRLAAACKVIEYGLDADVVDRFADRLERLETKCLEAVVAAPANNWTENNDNTWEVRDESNQNTECAA